MRASPRARLAATLAALVLTSMVSMVSDDSASAQSAAKPVTTATGLQMIDTKVGTCATPRTGQICVMHYTGWGDNWKDPDTEKFYYTKGPGLAYDAAKLIEQKKVVLVALDNPFTDPVAEGFLQGKAAPPEGTPDGLPFAIHHYNLAHSGTHQIQNANLGALAKDKVWLSCTMILPLRAQGASGSPVRPVSIGAPSR